MSVALAILILVALDVLMHGGPSSDFSAISAVKRAPALVPAPAEERRETPR